MADEELDLNGLRVLVTGASSGIGAAAAVAFARAGATVAICARRADRLAEVLDECRAWSPPSCSFTVDLADLDGIAAFAARVEAELGGVDVLVNNAGIPKRRSVVTMTPDDVEGVMAVNYFSPVRLTLALLPGMRERDFGHVVNVSSMGVHSAAARVGAYSASKAALELFTEALYLDLAGTGVQAHLFIPGTTATEFSTPKEGNDPPFTYDPAAVASAEDVAAALVACLADRGLRSFASPSLAEACAQREADVNRYLGGVRKYLASQVSR